MRHSGFPLPPLAPNTQDALRGDLHDNLRTGVQLCSEDLMAHLNNGMREQFAELQVPRCSRYEKNTLPKLSTQHLQHKIREHVKDMRKNTEV